MTTPTKEIGPVLSDLIQSIGDQEYTCVEVTVTNASEEDTLVVQLGNPVVVASGALVAAADIANATGLILQPCTLQPEESRKLLALVRGQAIVKKQGLPTLDHAGASINMTNFVNRIKAMSSPPILVRDPLATVSEQTT